MGRATTQYVGQLEEYSDSICQPYFARERLYKETISHLRGVGTNMKRKNPKFSSFAFTQYGEIGRVILGKILGYCSVSVCLYVHH